MSKDFKTLQRATRWVSDATITENMHIETEIRQFTATIKGWRNWKIVRAADSVSTPQIVEVVEARVRAIKARIEAGDDAVFSEPNEFIDMPGTRQPPFKKAEATQ